MLHIQDTKQPTVRMRWSSDSHEIYYDVKLDTSDDNICGIMHEPIKDVMPDALPQLWNLLITNPDETIVADCVDVTDKIYTVNCVTLVCGHQFHISILAVHFALNGMRCPICREGCDEKLCVNKLKIDQSERQVLESYVNATNQRSRDEIDENEVIIHSLISPTNALINSSNSIALAFNAWTLFSRPMHLQTFSLSGLNNLLASNLLLIAQCRVYDSITVSHTNGTHSVSLSTRDNQIPSVAWQTRLLRSDDVVHANDPLNQSQTISSPPDITPPGHTLYRVHRSFRRSLFATINRMSECQTAFLHFTVDHPLLPNQLFSQPLQISRLNTENMCINIETPDVDFALGAIHMQRDDSILLTLHTSAIEMINASIHWSAVPRGTDFTLIPMSEIVVD